MTHDEVDRQTRLELPTGALVSLLRSTTLADLIDPGVELSSGNDPLMRFAEFWNVMQIVIDSTESGTTFSSREDAREQLFAFAPGGGFGIPTFIQDLVLSHLVAPG